jgi:hypothetical protein
MAEANDGAFCAHVEMLESREQASDFRTAPARRIADVIGARCLSQHRRLLRQRWRGESRHRCACGQGVNETAPAHAFFELFGLTMQDHVSLTREFQQSDAGLVVGKGFSCREFGILRISPPWCPRTGFGPILGTARDNTPIAAAYQA